MEKMQTLGKYEILGELGRGGFSVVYKARDARLGEVALKVLRTEYASEPEVVARFLEEARKTFGLKHRNIVRIHAVDEDQGVPYIAMEYLPGGALTDRLGGDPLPLDAALTILGQVAAALDYAHRRKLVHRDVKPSNILFDDEGQAVLVDFGLVKSLSASRMTTAETILGTPHYMAPEQASAKDTVDARADVYSLGVVAYEMLTGSPPFDADTPMAVLMAHLNASPPDPSEHNPSLDAGVRAAMLKALAKSPDDRFGSAGAFVQALRQAWHTVKQTQQTETTLDTLYTQAQTALKAEQWAELARLCLEMRGLNPDFRDVTTLLALATTRVLEEDKKRQQVLAYRQQYTNAQRLLADHAYAEAIAALEALPPGFADVTQQLQQARAGQIKVELYAQAQTKLAERLYADACTDLLALLEQDIDYEGAADCLRAATAGVLEHLTDVQSELETARAELTRSQGDTEALHARVTVLEAEYEQSTLIQAEFETVLHERDDLLENVAQLREQIQPPLTVLEASQSINRLLTCLRLRAQVDPLKSPNDVWLNPTDGKAMVRVSAGEFLYGDNKEKRTLPEFWIDKTPVTNAEYAQFVQATDRKPPQHWKGKIPPKEIADHPVTYVSWHDAVAYAEWAGKRLPAEEEWEKAARGTDGCTYPWGYREPMRELCNFNRNEKGTTPVGKYSPQGDSPYGCVDMAGNVWQWTTSDYDQDSKVVRGGSWSDVRNYVRSTLRFRDPPTLFSNLLGFRCVVVRTQD